MRVAAGAVARKVLGDGVAIRGAVVQIGPHAVERGGWDWNEVENNPSPVPGPRPCPSGGGPSSTASASGDRPPAR